MIDYAKKYENELRAKFYDIAFDPFYKFAIYTPWRNDFEIPNSTYDYHSFVSINGYNIIGYIAYRINREDDSVYRMQIINFIKDRSFLFGKDAFTCAKNIFDAFNFRKLTFDVIIGNPIEKTYDKIIKKYGGRIVGTKEKEMNNRRASPAVSLTFMLYFGKGTA
ncbi:hypothetical protein FACS1894110_27060 [Spirochaetia bacterium]|nr:hypothetical protein FACS1894110_27060 [Spirochaetia bacterium]